MGTTCITRPRAQEQQCWQVLAVQTGAAAAQQLVPVAVTVRHTQAAPSALLGDILLPLVQAHPAQRSHPVTSASNEKQESNSRGGASKHLHWRAQYAVKEVHGWGPMLKRDKSNQGKWVWGLGLQMIQWHRGGPLATLVLGKRKGRLCWTSITCVRMTGLASPRAKRTCHMTYDWDFDRANAV